MTPGDIASAVAGSASAGAGKDFTLEEALGELDVPTEQGSTPGSDEKLKLKDAIAQIFGGQEQDPLAGDQVGTKQKPRAPTKPIDPDLVTQRLVAVIIGYTTDSETGAVQSVILAVDSDGTWRIAGSLSGLSEEVLSQLESQFTALRRESPFVETELEANWGEPLLRCRVEADYSKAEDEYRELRFLGLK